MNNADNGAIVPLFMWYLQLYINVFIQWWLLVVLAPLLNDMFIKRVSFHCKCPTY